MTDSTKPAIKTRGPRSLCSVLDQYYERAIELDLDFESTQEGYVVTETYSDRLADTFSIDVTDRYALPKQLLLINFKNEEQPFEIIEHFNGYPQSFTPLYIVSRSIRGFHNADYGINNEAFVKLEMDKENNVIGFTFDRGISLTQIAREIINGEPVKI